MYNQKMYDVYKVKPTLWGWRNYVCIYTNYFMIR